MQWGKISKLMESEMSNCLLIWLIDWVTVQSDCLFESKSNNLLDWVTVCLTAWLCEEWMAVCLTNFWLTEWLCFRLSACLYVSSFLSDFACLFVCICSFVIIYLCVWFYVCGSVWLFWYCSWLLFRLSEWLFVWLFKRVTELVQLSQYLYAWVFFSDGLIEGGSVWLFLPIACLTKGRFVWLTELLFFWLFH